VAYGCKCGCASFREHVGGVHLRPAVPAPKVTVDHTDDTVNRTTEHFTSDRVDAHVSVLRPIGRNTHG
jgi:hypothetical protein